MLSIIAGPELEMVSAFGAHGDDSKNSQLRLGSTADESEMDGDDEGMEIL